jgi:uncharacterized integral membrane protein
MHTLRKILWITLLILVLLLAVQNLVLVEFNFLVWSLRLPRGLLVLLSLGLGFGLGLGWAQLRSARDDKSRRPAGPR